jgi:hypothetical protein
MNQRRKGIPRVPRVIYVGKNPNAAIEAAANDDVL